MFFGYCSRFVACSVVRRVLFVACCLLFVVWCLFLVVRCLLLVVCGLRVSYWCSFLVAIIGLLFVAWRLLLMIVVSYLLFVCLVGKCLQFVARWSWLSVVTCCSYMCLL